MKIRKFSDLHVSCVSPRHIYNKYLGEYLTVPCGHCPTCRQSKSNRLVSRLESMRSQSSMCLFFTLTYSNDFVPIARFHRFYADVSTYSSLHRKRVSSKVKYNFDLFDGRMSALDSRILSKGAPSTVDYKGFPSFTFSVVSKRDCQLFIKRFRKLFSYAFPEVAFKYFIVGEYGSKTMRAHYHGLIFLSDTVSFCRLQDILRMSWRFGNYDLQVVSSSASSYVASYINSLGVLPYFLENTEAFKPFYLQSVGTCLSSFASPFEEYKESFFNPSFTRLEKSSNGWVSVPMPKAARIRLYPLCRGFYKLDFNSKLHRYNLFANEVEKQGTENPLISVPCRSIDGLFSTLTIPFSLLYQFRKKFTDSSKSVDYIIDNSIFQDWYVSKRVYDIAKFFKVSVYCIVKTICRFYLGDSQEPILPSFQVFPDSDPCSLPNHSFQLGLLRMQYQAMELAESDDDLMFLYSYFNGVSTDFVLEDVQATHLLEFLVFDHRSLLSRYYKDIQSYAEKCSLSYVKHKDRNSYLKLKYK